LNMKNEVFVYKKWKPSFLDGYLYVSNYSIEDYPDHPIAEAKICKPCAGQMEMAYFFRKLCRENKVILRREYLPKSTNDQIGTEEINCDGAVEERVTDDISEIVVPVVNKEARHTPLRIRKITDEFESLVEWMDECQIGFDYCKTNDDTPTSQQLEWFMEVIFEET
jgi:hypothetical protein